MCVCIYKTFSHFVSSVPSAYLLCTKSDTIQVGVYIGSRSVVQYPLQARLLVPT